MSCGVLTFMPFTFVDTNTALTQRFYRVQTGP
jgi:hypothetical protein